MRAAFVAFALLLLSLTLSQASAATPYPFELTTVPQPAPSTTPFAPTVAQSMTNAIASTCGTSNTTTALATQPAANDAIIIYVISSTTGTLAAPAGFTVEDSNSSTSLHYAEWWKYSTGSDGTSWTYTDSVGNGACVAFVADVSHVNQTSPFDQHGLTLGTLNATTGPFGTSALVPSNLNELPIAMLNTGTSSQSVAAVLPATLTLGTSAAQFTTQLYYDLPLQSLRSYTAQMTVTTNNAFAHQVQVLDLIAGGTATPTPSPSPTPTATPTPGTGAYVYQGCQVYNGSFGAADPIANANVSALTVSSSNTSIMSNIGTTTFSGSNTANLEIVNLATAATGTLVVGSTGHSPPITANATTGTGGAGASVHWIGGTFLFEGTCATACSGADGHWTTLLTDTCRLEEGGGGNWTSGGGFTTFDGFIDLLGDSYVTNWANKSDNWGVGGFGGLGFVYYGEDFSLTAINHPGYVSVPTSILISGTNGVNISPGAGNGAGSCSGAANCLELGDMLRLQSSFTCPGDTKAALICNAAKTFGVYVGDTHTGGGIQVFAGLDHLGNDDSDTAVWTMIGGWTLNNFQVITRCTSGKPCVGP